MCLEAMMSVLLSAIAHANALLGTLLVGTHGGHDELAPAAWNHWVLIYQIQDEK